jgi:hypothetical protein
MVHTILAHPVRFPLLRSLERLFDAALHRLLWLERRGVNVTESLERLQELRDRFRSVLERARQGEVENLPQELHEIRAELLDLIHEAYQAWRGRGHH